MVYHAVARAKLTVERVIFPGPSRGKKMSKPRGRALWEQHARMIQRLWHADNPPHPHRSLITAEDLARAELLQPEYELPAAVQGGADDDDDDDDDDETNKDGETTREVPWPEHWENRRSLAGVLNRPEWRAFPTNLKETENAQNDVNDQTPAPKPAQNPPPSESEPAQPAQYEHEINSRVPLEDPQHRPELDRRPAATPATVLPDNHHVPDRPQQAKAQADSNGFLSQGQASRPLPIISQAGADVQRTLEREFQGLCVDSHRPRHTPSSPMAFHRPNRARVFSIDKSPSYEQKRYEDGYGPPREGYRDGPAEPQPQRSRDDAEPIGDEGLSGGSGAFSQDDLRTFLAWRRERRRARAGDSS